MDERLLGLQVGLQKIESLSFKVNTGIKLILVICGGLTIETNSRYYQMQEKDLLVINRNQLYQVRGSKDNCTLVLSITDNFIEQVYSDYRNVRFECFSQEAQMGRELMFTSLRKLLAELAIALYRRDETYRLELQEYVCKIMSILIRRFKQEGSAFEKMDVENQRLTQIVHYIEENYGQPITLADTAEKFYLSSGYLSRYFKQKMGMGFSRFLMNVRLKRSMKDLLYTSSTISQIAMDNGFPNVKSFTTLFKEVYGETPSAFRIAHAETPNAAVSYALQDTVIPVSSPEILAKLGMLLMDDDTSYSNTDTRFEKLALSVHEQTGEVINRPGYILIIGNLKNLLREDVRTQFLLAKEELPIRYIGVRNLINETLIPPRAETDERIATISPYFNLAAVLNFVKKEGTALFIWIDCMEVLYAEEKYFVQLQEFMNYCLQLYGETYLNTWHIMFSGPAHTNLTAEEMRRIYVRLRNLVKQLVPGIQIGAFLHYSFGREKVPDRHAWILAEAEIIDFFGYEANQNEVINFEEIDHDNFLLTKDYIKEKTEQVIGYLKKNRLEKKPLHLVNWNTLSGNTRYTNGTFFRGALLLRNILDLADKVSTLGFWINTELHEEEKKDRRIQLDGLELFYYFNGKRPVYFALQFFSRLQGMVIRHDPDCIVTCNERGYQVVLMNRNYIHPFLSVEDTFLHKLNKDIHVTLSGLSPGDYQVRKLVLDKDHGALYTKWCDLSTKHGMDEEITEYILRSTYPRLEVFDETSNGEWSFYSYLTINAIHFFDIRRVVG